ncbi:MAG: CocE/NonD family hydrolase [Pseudomonadota bacterium]
MKKLLLGVSAAVVVGAIGVYVAGVEKLLPLLSKGPLTEMIVMRDGTRLATDIYLPRFSSESGTVYIATPYGKQAFGTIARGFNAKGFAVAIQDDRGQGDSEGEWESMPSLPEDLEDTLDYIAAQDWSNGRVGMVGCSFPGQSTIFAAQLNHPALKTIIAQSAGGAVGEYLGRHRYGGGNHAGLDWIGPAVAYLSLMSVVDSYGKSIAEAMDGTRVTELFNRVGEVALENPMEDYIVAMGPPYDGYDDLWRDLIKEVDDTHAGMLPKRPWLEGDTRAYATALHVNGWGDYGTTETMLQRQVFADNASDPLIADNQMVIMAPAIHCHAELQSEANAVIGERPIGDTRFPYIDTYMDWFSHWLDGPRGEQYDQEQNFEMDTIQYYQIGEGWKSTEQWPPAKAEPFRLYLSSTGDARTRSGTGLLSAEPVAAEDIDRFEFDPRDPTPTRGGPNIPPGNETEGYHDQGDIEDRRDVLVYTTPPLEEDLVIAGPLSARLYVSTEREDADFHVKVVEVLPDGTPYNLKQGGTRLSLRNGDRVRVPALPDEVYAIDVDIHSIAATVKAGHRLRLEVAGGDFPRSAINFGLKHWLDTPTPAHRQPYEKRLHLSAETPSYLTLYRVGS